MQRTAKILRFPKPLTSAPTRLWWERLPVIAGLIFVSILLLHIPLLRLPYFWDEAGYYIPAGRDIWQHFQFIPTSTLTNAHPPLVMAWLAAAWKIFGYHAAVTRVAMLLVATFTLTGVFHLARQVANSTVALASVVVTAIFPVFFAQSTMAHLDMAAAGFTLWGLAAYVRDRYPATAFWFALAGLAKETAILAPLALCAWELLGIATRESRWSKLFLFRSSLIRAAWLLVGVCPLAIWFAYHHHETGVIFGNPEFVRYNVATTLHPVRFLAALAQRLWQAFGYMNMFVLTIATLLAMTRRPISLESPERNGGGSFTTERQRITIPKQMVFLVVLLSYLVALSVVGGAVLARYLLPVYPLVVIVFVSTLWRRLPWWPAFVGVVCLAFALGLVINPPYQFAPEDNLNYADFVRLHQQAAQYLEQHPPAGRVLTAWPGSDELTKPYLGYVKKPIQIVAIENFSMTQIMAAREAANTYDAAFLFSTKYEPHGLLIRLPFWETLQKRYFGYHVDLPPQVTAEMLQGHVVFHRSQGGQWVAVLTMDRAFNARLRR
ncbi:MAG TPA: glycosyltransferase family 39 protein [Terriglobales bacterium]|nr:glycosyltransferase family 39 protein [Terriglobales bacterium]